MVGGQIAHGSFCGHLGHRGAHVPSWRTPKIVGNWLILLRQGPPFLRFEVAWEPNGDPTRFFLTVASRTLTKLC